MNWFSGEHADTLLQPLQNQWPDVEVRFSEKENSAHKAHVGIFYVNIAALWRLCAGHFRVHRVFVLFPWSSTPAYSCHPPVEMRWVAP